MGMIHYLAAKRIQGAQVDAIATRDARKRAGDWTMIQGNFGPRGGHEDLRNVRTYATADELIADPELDLIDICLPNDQHAGTAIAALAAGKHVLVEKAIALSLGEADQMLAAAAKAGRQLMVAHVLPFFADFKFALEAIQSGRYGKLLAAHFRRHISPPDWSSAMQDFATTGGGPIVDLHIHDTHFINLACGVPKQVYSRGLLRGGTVEYASTQYLYDGPAPVISATTGAISQSARPFTHGYEIYLERATIYYEAGSPVTVYSADGVSRPELTGGDEIDAFAREIQCAVNAVQSNAPADMLSAKLARDALALCLREAESVTNGRAVTV